MINATFLSKDEHGAGEGTTHWFELNGTAYGSTINFDKSVYGVNITNGVKLVLDADGAPVSDEHRADVVLRECVV